MRNMEKPAWAPQHKAREWHLVFKRARALLLQERSSQRCSTARSRAGDLRAVSAFPAQTRFVSWDKRHKMEKIYR